MDIRPAVSLSALCAECGAQLLVVGTRSASGDCVRASATCVACSGHVPLPLALGRSKTILVVAPEVVARE